MTAPNPTPDKITAAELRAAFRQLTERLDELAASLQNLLEGLAAAASQPQPVAAPAGQTVEFVATSIIYGVDDNGQPTYKAKGGQYTKFGVRIWPEMLPELGINPASLKPGPNPVSLRLIALMGERGPRKVVGLAK